MKRYKIFFCITIIFFLLLNFPLLDWFLHSEKMWYDEYELDYESSYMYALYEKLGILDEVVGFIGSITYGSKWMHICYHLYCTKTCFEMYHITFPCEVFFLVYWIRLAVKDVRSQPEEKRRKTKLFYGIPLAVVMIVCIYGTFIYAPRYHNCIKDIIESV